MKRLVILLLIVFVFSELSAQDQELLIKEGNSFFSAGQYAKAEERYKQVLAERADDPSILYNLGNTQFKLKKYQDSMRYYLDAIKRKPNDYLLRNLYYHMGNAQQAMAFENMQEEKKNENNWPEILRLLDTVELKNVDRKQQELLVRMLSEIKVAGEKGEYTQAEESLHSFLSLVQNINDAKLKETIQKIEKLLNVASDEKAQSAQVEQKINQVKKSIEYYEESFQNYHKALEMSRKVAIKEGRDIAEVGNFVKNNWAIARERWGLLHEVLNDLLKQNLKLKDGVQSLAQVQKDLYDKLEQTYFASQVQEILDYTLKVLAEFHIDYRDDIRQLQKIAEDDLKKKTTELNDLKATQAQAAKGKGEDAEKTDYTKQEKAIATAQKIFDGLRDVEGIENYVEDSLKRGDLFGARRYSFQMLFFLNGLNDYLNNGSPIDRAFSELILELHEIADLVKQADENTSDSTAEADPLANQKKKQLKVASEKLLDVDYINEQLVLYLEDYLKEGSLKSTDKRDEASPVNQWLLTTLNDYVKTVVHDLVEDLKKSKESNEKLRVSTLQPNTDRAHLKEYMESNQQNYRHYQNTLMGFVESVRMCIQKIESVDAHKGIDHETLAYFDLTEHKIKFLLDAVEKEGVPNEIKESLPYLTQRYQSYHDTLQKIPKLESIEELSAQLKVMKNDLSQFIFMIDPMKTLAFKFEALLAVNQDLFSSVENFASKKGDLEERVNEIFLYFDILVRAFTDSKEKKPSDATKEDAEKAEQAQKQKEEILENIRKAKSYLKQYQGALGTLKDVSAESLDLYAALHKVFTLGVVEAALRSQGQPNKAVDTLKQGIGMQTVQKNYSSAMIDKRWKDVVHADQLEYSIKFQQDLIELIGVRGIQQVMQMKDEFAKQGSQQPGGQSATPESAPDFDGAMALMKEVLTEGDKIISFYEAREFSNTPEKHDKIIELLTEAIKKLEDKNDQKQDQKENQDQNQNQENSSEQSQQGQMGQDGQDENNQENKKNQERKPLEISPDQARQLLNDLNKRDEDATKDKQDVKKRPINTPRPW